MSNDRPRIAQLTPSLSLGGATGLLIQLVARLREDGYEAEVVTGGETESGITMQKQADELDVPVRILPSLHRNPSPFKDLRALKDLTRLFEEREYDVVQIHRAKAVVLGTLAARRAGVPGILWHIHGWAFHEHSSWFDRNSQIWTYRWLSPRISRIIAVSEDTKRVGLKNRIAWPEHYAIIYEAFDLDRFSAPPLSREDAKRRMGVDPDTLVVGSLTRFDDQKCPLDLIDAAALVLREMPEVHFLIVGDGPLREETEQRVRERGIEGSVTLPGVRWDTPEVLSAFDVFALSSLWEGFPICYLEAMALEIPVVGTDAGGAAECVLDGETGFIVPQHRPDEMADRLLTLLRDVDLRARMGEAGREWARQFGYDRLAREMAKLYDDVLANAPKR